MRMQSAETVEATVSGNIERASHSRWVGAMALAVTLLAFGGRTYAQACSVDSDCNDNKSCTVDACKHLDTGGTVCQFTRDDSLCADAFSCTNDGCNPTATNADPTTGCIHSKDDSKCDDGFSCTQDGCNPASANHDTAGCVHPRVDELCNDQKDCTSDGCNPTDPNHEAETGCVFVSETCCTTDALCDDGIECTVDECNHGTGECQHSRKDNLCNDGFSCTEDKCVPTDADADPRTGCITSRHDYLCDDGRSCTDDECVPTSEDADPTTGCITKRHDDRCDDYDDCTTDGCNPTVEGSDMYSGCVYDRIENCCKSDDDCPPDSKLLACVDNYCDLETHTCKAALIQSGARVSGDQKGSLLVFSKIEIKWDADGKLIQDTILDFSNDADRDGVEIQAYFVNGDRNIEERHDMEGNVVQEFEPGWNTADCRFNLTKNQPHFWSAANGSTKCQSFTVLDMDGPGRLDPEASDGTRLLRGFVVMWAVKFIEPAHNGQVHDQGENGYWEEIRWNHLKGDAVIVNYSLGSAWEYNAWAYQARCGETGEPLLDCIEYKKSGPGCADSAHVPGRLDMDGYQYDSNFDELLMDFYASGSTGLSSADVGVMVDTDLTLHSMDIDVRQDGNGPVLTKAEFEIFNQNESKFSGTRRCICCWDQTLLSNYVRTVAVPNHFLRNKLGTDKGYARIDGVRSSECDYEEICGIEPRVTLGPPENHYDLSRGTALLGLAFKILTFTGANTNIEWAGGNLHGVGEQSATIIVDVERGSGEAHGEAAPAANPGVQAPAASVGKQARGAGVR